MTVPPFEIGVFSFAERTADPATGHLVSPEQRLRDLIETAVLADEVGLDLFGVGEHHRPDFVASAPAVILAAIAARTKRIRLTSAVTVLSSDDPVRVFQDFATLDLISGGRAEIMAGRGSFIESFPLFGYALEDYESLFAQNLELLLKIREGEKVTWTGGHRAPIDNLGIYPRPVQEPLPVWLAVGGTPQSVVRAATLGLPLAVAIIGGMPERFRPLVDLYRDTARKVKRDPASLSLSINSHGLIADSSRQAMDDYYPSATVLMNKIGRERGWPPASRQQLEQNATLRGADFVGAPEQIIEKILFQHELFGHQRMALQLGIGTIAHSKVMRAVELLGTEVAPVVRKEIAARTT
jgi:probable LLM family oxidoreductase